MIRCAALSSLCLAAVCSLSACGGDDAKPADAAGDYTIAITSGTNGCGFENWQEGATSTGIQLGITEDTATGDATATVDGISALFLDLLQGGHAFAGSVSGNNLLLELLGSVEQVTSGCTHLVNSTLDANLNGDILIGTVTYTVADEGAAECAALVGCESVQSFNGARAPQP